MVLSACDPLPDTSDPPAAQPPAAANLNTSMAWVSMREGLAQFDNGTQGTRTIGVIVSKDATPPAYANVKDLPGFYTRKTKADGTARTVYLSMTDKMTVAKFNASVTVSVDGGATGFVSAIDSAPELLHPNSNYYAHFYEITGAAGTAIEKLEFTTENFPTIYPTTRGTYSSVYNKIATGSTSPAIEYKTSESYLIPARFYYVSGSAINQFLQSITFHRVIPSSGTIRPFRNPSPVILFYDLYNMTPSGPNENITLWDEMIGIGSIIYMDNDGKTYTHSLSEDWKINHQFGGQEFSFYDNKKAVLVTD
ncbi:hypothetical protein P0082_10505 [Candidatus Haliotispira prima]|uniref:Lipoprotein n=1 Tax=Candidatus Haliotispira prima TaxID=3034016 RepID=A0ABY8MG05_9SPIO|nr:hypothetical protein P0082_10505 [Candidatus Haliotispira prima]